MPARMRASPVVASLLSSILLLLLLIIAKAKAEGCHPERPLVNAHFEISCTKSLDVDIVCLDGSNSSNGWNQLPAGSFNLSSVRSLTIKGCSFPANVSLLAVTRALGVQTNGTLKIVAPLTGLRREHLAGFTLAALHIYGKKPSQGSGNASRQAADLSLPADLLDGLKLEELLIDQLPVLRIPSGFFRGHGELRDLEIVYAGLEELRKDDLAELKGLRNLSLFGNDIRLIEPSSFDRLLDLRICDLSKNRLRSLPADLFRRLSRLARLNLSENEFESLDPQLLRIDSSRLKRVRLNHNRGGRLRSLPPGFFRNLSNLSYVEITSNNFTSLPPDLFFGAHSLAALNVSNNSLTFLPDRLFEGTSLVDLRASENQIAYLPKGIFEDLSLERLFLNHNRLTNLSSSVLSGLTELQLLQISHNNLTSLESDICKYLNKVRYVDLSHNQLTTLLNPHSQPLSVFLDCEIIVQLDLSYNKLTRVFEDWMLRHELKDLNLEGNKITNVTVDQLILSNDAALNLRNNEISTIDLKDLEERARTYRASNPNINKNAVVSIQNNPLHCDCHLLDFFRYLEHKLEPDVYTFINIEADEMRCAAPAELKEAPIASISSQELRCRASSKDAGDACAGNCTCWTIPGKQVLAVDCSRRNLSSVPSHIGNPQDWAIELNMTGNRLTSTPALNHSYLMNVTVLDLSFNNISRVDLDVFSPALRELQLHNNSLTRLDVRVIEHLYNDELLNNLTLHGNNWICDCESRGFLSAVQKKQKIFDLREVRCLGTNKPIVDLTANELCDGVIALIVWASIIIAICSAAFGFLVVVYYKCLNRIKIWLYSKQCCLWFFNEDELDKDKLYDAFISFSSKDEEFVERELVAKLEDGPKPYKLCIHSRDWLAGEMITEQIIRSVEESRRTVIVLSPNFIESEWAIMEFRAAHDQALREGRARVVVILYGDVGPSSDLDPDLKNYLNTTTYLKWGDPWFWDKLRYALPHRRELTKRRSRKARILENHLSQRPIGNHHNHQDKGEIIALPKITAHSNDSTKLLESDAGIC